MILFCQLYFFLKIGYKCKIEQKKAILSTFGKIVKKISKIFDKILNFGKTGTSSGFSTDRNGIGAAKMTGTDRNRNKIPSLLWSLHASPLSQQGETFLYLSVKQTLRGFRQG